MNPIKELEKAIGNGESSAAAIARYGFMAALRKYDEPRWLKLRDVPISGGLEEINAVCDEVGYGRATGSDEVVPHLNGLRCALEAAVELRKTFEIEALDGPVRGESALEAIAEAKVVRFAVDEGCLVVAEMCDECFRVKLTKEQAQQMVAEIQALIDKL